MTGFYTYPEQYPLYGVNQPILLDYHDQELITADFATLTQDALRAMASVRPEVVITFGPSGISDHDDHKTMHRAATEAFHRYRHTAVVAPRLYYVALPPEVAAPAGGGGTQGGHASAQGAAGPAAGHAGAGRAG